MLIGFVLLAVLFILGLTNTIFKLPTRKFIIQITPWFQVFLQKPPPKESKVVSKIDEKKETKPIRDQGQLKMIFATFDKNKDGFITKEEMMESFEKIGLGISEKEIEDMVKKSDLNGDGLIEFDEFCDLYEHLVGSGGGGDVAEEEEGGLRDAFDVFDGDKDGLISVEELGVVLCNLGMRELGGRLESCKEMIRNVDVDGDGMVSFDEFKMMMKSGRSLVQVS